MKTAGIFNDTSVSGHYGCTAVMKTLTAELQKRSVKPVYLWPVAEDWQPHERLLEDYRPDVIVVNGEGTLHHSRDRKRTRDLIAVVHHAKKMGVPAHLVNASITALDEAALHAIAAFDSIYVRESESKNFLAVHGIEARVVPDLSLGLSQPVQDETRTGVIVTDSVYGDTTRSLEAFAAAGDFDFVKMKPRPPVAIRLKAKILKKLRKSPEETIWRARSDAEGFARLLARKELVMTGRFHSVLLSILTNTPFVALPSNTRKIEAVLNDVFACQSRMISVDDLSAPKFLAHISKGFPFSRQEKDALARYRHLAERGRHDMFDLIAESCLP
ncbi:polysaccharide pyruvyl transferase family protein [Sulfitobacter sp. 1A12779]|uniref:polysaccharide pyruvyl transferase family protein n=1 Tax=Sulfitobacter sp. 1A12779 TaxID=3368599 RepID=UPI0037476200